MLVRRDVTGEARKQSIPLGEDLGEAVQETLDCIQANLYQQALGFREEHTYHPEDYDQFKDAVEAGFVEAWWCGDAACEAQIKEDTKATLRCIPLSQDPGTGRCIQCGKAAEERAVFSRAY